MEWRRWGLKNNPYALNEINDTTLELFMGRNSEIKSLQNAFNGIKRVIFLEGEQGIGKTSIGNFWRYSSMQKRLCFTPYPEIRIAPEASFYVFAMKAIEALNWSLSQSHPFISRDAEFKAHENKSKELFKPFMGSMSPDIASFSDAEDRYLYDAVKEIFLNIHHMISKLNYEFGTVIQISFAGLNESYLSKEADDFKRKLWGLYLIEGFRWILIGEPLFQEWLFHSESKVLSTDLYKILITPFDLPQIHELLQRRRDYLALSQNAQLPMAPEVIDYLYGLSGGNLKRILSICEKLTELSDGSQELDLKLAKPILAKYFQDEIRRQWQLTPAAFDILRFLINEKGASPGLVADRMKKLRPNISKILVHLKEANLVRSEVKGRNRIYYPTMEAKIAFS